MVLVLKLLIYSPLTIIHIALLALPAPQFKLVMDSVIWAIKHTMRDIADMGLNRATNVFHRFS